MASELDNINDTLLLDASDGITHIERGSPLTRLHFFDGKFLRATALTLEQDYHRTQVRLSNQAGGFGVVHGFSLDVDGDMLQLGAGFALTPSGHGVLAALDFEVKLNDLVSAAIAGKKGTNAAKSKIAKAAKVAKGENTRFKDSGVVAEAPVKVMGSDFEDCVVAAAPTPQGATGPAVYLVTVGPVDALCGNEAVYGKLCEAACATDSQRPYWLEGVVVRLHPLSLTLPDSAPFTADKHYRNRVASAYFAAERAEVGSLMSRAGIEGGIWCEPTGFVSRTEIAIGVIARSGDTTVFIDSWTARRERMEAQARGYWQARMAMRPWNVFLAQILQFQCQLSGIFRLRPLGGGGLDPNCEELKGLVGDTLVSLEKARLKYQAGTAKLLENLKGNEREMVKAAFEQSGDPYSHLEAVRSRLGKKKDEIDVLPRSRMLLNAGFVELPPAGYLPVLPGQEPINAQLSRMFGEGVKLFFCTARRDYLPHALEQAQHMDRISLTRGLDDPAAREEVEIFVPNGERVDGLVEADSSYWTVSLESWAASALVALGRGKFAASPKGGVEAVVVGARLAAKRRFTGIARTRVLDGGGAAITLVCSTAVRASEYGKLVKLARMERAKMLAEEKPLPDGATPAAPSPDEAEGDAEAADAAPFLALYIDLDIQRDPFDEAEGTPIPADVEICSVAPMLGQRDNRAVFQRLSGTGSLVVERKTPIDAQQVRLVASLRMDLTSEVGNTSTRHTPTLELKLTRRGSQLAGEFTALMLDQQELALNAGWDGVPRRATLGVVSGTASKSRLPEEKVKAREDATFEVLSTGLAETPVAELAEIAAPTKESGQRLDALNALDALAQAGDDDAFLARGKQKLFPDEESTGEARIRAREDWVMFRRRRTANCGGAKGATRPAATETFRVWHALAESAAHEKALVAYLDGKDSNVDPDKLRVRQVDVLHYLDEAVAPEEFASDILKAWSRVDTGPSVVLGRVWEYDPARGQGWQNRARLKRLVDILGDIVEPPAGSTALAVLATAPDGLVEEQLGGGMVLVTRAREVEPKATRHLVVVVRSSQFVNLQSELAKRTPAAWKKVLAASDQISPDLTSLLQLTDTTMDAASLKQLDGILEVIDLRKGKVEQAFAVRLVPAPELAPPDRQFENVAEKLRTKIDLDGFVIKATGGDDLGQAADVATLVVFRDG